MIFVVVAEDTPAAIFTIAQFDVQDRRLIRENISKKVFIIMHLE